MIKRVYMRNLTVLVISAILVLLATVGCNAYAPLGLFMGKFTLEGDTYTRYPHYFTAKSAVDLNALNEKVPESYTVQEMNEILNQLQ